MAGKILYVCQEIFPYLPESEQSALCRQLVQAMQERGNEIRTFMPRYGCINERRNQLHEVIRLSGMNLIIDDNDHQLIIKVASIPTARVQIYFIDNDDYFARKAVLSDDAGWFADNDERAIFFARGVLETVKKLRWNPSVVHCHGWFSAVVPIYLKHMFADDPVFRDVKIAVSLYDDAFPGELDAGFRAKVEHEGVQDENLKILDNSSYQNLMRFVMDYADGIVLASEGVDAALAEYARRSGNWSIRRRRRRDSIIIISSMKNYRGVRKWLNAVLVLGVAGMLTFAGCTEVDDTLGYELVPGNQQMEMRLHSIRKGFEARMFMSDSVKSSNLSYGYFGTTKSDTFGIRKVGFMTQYLWASISDRKNWYGYRPIFDSLQLLLSVSSYAGDTLQPQRFGVYRILNNDYLKDNDGNGDGTTDTTFFTSFNPVEAGCVDENDPLFTFTFPDGTTTGPATTAVTLEPTAAGLDYVKELMMQEGKYKNDSTVYTNDSLWVNYFCGLAILPLDFNGTTGATFATTLAESGMMLYGRNRDSVDATLIRDTLQTLFYFYDEYATTYGNVSVNTVERTNTRYIDYDAIVEKPGGGTVEPQQPFELGYVEGMGGALVELTLTDEFLSVLGELQAEQEDEGYRTVAINQALLSIYVDGVTDGGWEQGFSQKVIERFDASISRLGLYTDFKTLTPVSDYAYDYEQQYEVTLPYGGYLNRSLGCYTLNISSHIQRLWRAYQEAPIDPETGERQYTEAQKRMMTLYLAPGATDLFTFNRIALQGGIKAGENAPIHMELTYTLIK